jgi:hypothetical protein
MFVTGQGVRRGLQGNMIASVIKLYILQSLSRIYVLGVRRLSAGWMLLTDTCDPRVVQNADKSQKPRQQQRLALAPAPAKSEKLMMMEIGRIRATRARAEYDYNYL